MKTSQTIRLMGVFSLLLGGILAPTIYATEDGGFPVFPTVIEGDGEAEIGTSTASTSTSGETVVSPATPTKTGKTTVTKTTVEKTSAASVKEEETDVKRKDYFVTNESGVFSPFGFVKKRILGDAEAGEGGVVFALTSQDAKPTSQGDFRYQIFYANNSGDTLRNVSIQVFLPKDVRYLDSSLRPSSRGNGIVVYEIGKIAPGEEEVIQLEARLKKKNAKEIIVPATMIYEDVDGGAHSVTASANNAFNGKNGGGLSASVLDGAGGIMLWLFVIILIVTLAFVAYQYFVLQASGRRV